MSICPECYKKIKGKGPNRTKKRGVFRHKTCNSGRYKGIKKQSTRWSSGNSDQAVGRLKRVGR